jgi:hypothetical protein
VLLGELGAQRQGDLAPARLDGAELGAEMPHHRLGGKAVRDPHRERRIELLLARRFPFVAHGRIGGPTRFDSLEVDNLAGARLAFETLHAAGHRRLAMLNAPRWLNFAREA